MAVETESVNYILQADSDLNFQKFITIGEISLTKHTRQEPIAVPVDGTLDLHCFQPGEIKDLVPEYLEECRKRNILQVRIIHGKGTGALRRIVHGRLTRLDYVKNFRIAGEDGGSWGATLVDLQAVERPPLAR